MKDSSSTSSEPTSDLPRSSRAQSAGSLDQASLDQAEPSGPSVFEARLARLEAQVKANSERLSEMTGNSRVRRQYALWTRLVILLLALGVFFYLRMRAGS